jgi:hypothetical protein
MVSQKWIFSKNRRWSIVSLLFAATLINYLDRAAYAGASPLVAQGLAGLARSLVAFSGPGLALQEANPVVPVPLHRFSHQIRESSHLAANVRWRDSPFINENHAAVVRSCYGPSFEQ